MLTKSGPGLQAAARQLGGVRIQNAINTWLQVTPLTDLAGFSRALGLPDQIGRQWRVFMQTYPIILMPAFWRQPFQPDFDRCVISVMSSAREILIYS